MYRAMYERKYRKSADDTTDAELEEFIRKSVLYSIVCCCVSLIIVDLCTVSTLSDLPQTRRRERPSRLYQPSKPCLPLLLRPLRLRPLRPKILVLRFC